LESNLSLDFVKVTEQAALSAARYVGMGLKDEADQAGVNAMRTAMSLMNIKGEVVIGEGERDEAPMLFIGEIIGQGEQEVDIAVDPVEGTNLVAIGLPNAIAVVSIAERGTLFNAPYTYMRKLAVGPKAADMVHIDAPVRDNLEIVANSLDRAISDLTVIILDRERHAQLIREVRDSGARIKLISDGDTDAAIATALSGTGVHCYMGTGGAPEGVLAAAAMKCLGGGFQGKLVPRNEEEAKRCQAMGVKDLNQVLTISDLVRSDDVIFVATGITDGDLLKGVRFFGLGARTHSIYMNSRTGTTRFIETIHKLKARPLLIRMD